jgi:replicative DNA helicase
VRIGQRSDLTSTSARMSMSNSNHIRIDAAESLTVAELSRFGATVAEEMVERLIARFPRR